MMSRLNKIIFCDFIQFLLYLATRIDNEPMKHAIKYLKDRGKRVDRLFRKNVLRSVEMLRLKLKKIAILKLQNVIRRRLLRYIIRDEEDDDTQDGGEVQANKMFAGAKYAVVRILSSLSDKSICICIVIYLNPISISIFIPIYNYPIITLHII